MTNLPASCDPSCCPRSRAATSAPDRAVDGTTFPAHEPQADRPVLSVRDHGEAGVAEVGPRELKADGLRRLRDSLLLSTSIPPSQRFRTRPTPQQRPSDRRLADRSSVSVLRAGRRANSASPPTRTSSEPRSGQKSPAGSAEPPGHVHGSSLPATRMSCGIRTLLGWLSRPTIVEI